MEAITRVLPRNDFYLEVWFNTGEHRLFDARPYLNKGVFQRLQNIALFKQAFVSLDTVCWPGNLDIAPETLYDRSVPISPDNPENHPKGQNRGPKNRGQA